MVLITSPISFFAGPNYFINNNNEQIALDALFWVLDQTSRIDIYYSKKKKYLILRLNCMPMNSLYQDITFIAISGSGFTCSRINTTPYP